MTTSTAHGYNLYDIIKISGANESVFNDEFTIASVPSTTTFTFPLTTGLSEATGTITCKIAPLGWTREFTGTNQSVYRSADVTGTRLYLRIDDTPAKTAKVNMYETMNGLDSGTGKSTDTFWAKSSVATSATRSWYIVGDSKRFYLMVEFYASWVGIVPCFFGDIVSFKTGFAWDCALGGFAATDPAYPYTGTNSMGSNNGATYGLILARSAFSVGGNAPMGILSVFQGSTMGVYTSQSAVFPSPIDNKTHLFECFVFDATAKSVRGKVPGYYAPAEVTLGAYANRDRFVQDSKTYMAFRIGTTGQNQWGNVFIDTIGPWE